MKRWNRQQRLTHLLMTNIVLANKIFFVTSIKYKKESVVKRRIPVEKRAQKWKWAHVYRLKLLRRAKNEV
ncbi:hypothetical protein MTO96_043763 [Rhipicephalus appendiculatus]